MKYLSIMLLTMTLLSCQSSGSQATAQSGTSAQVDVPRFVGDSALAAAVTQCEMGPRVPGTPPHQRCAAWLADRLAQHCDSLVRQQATVTTFDNKQLAITNLVGIFNPAATRRVLLMAHWDCRPWADADPDPALHGQPVMGANDGASGTAVLLEVARILHQHPVSIGVDILLTDAEDWGDSNDEDSWALGTQYWIAHPHVTGYKPMFGILLDMVGAPDAKFLREQYSMAYAQGFVDLVWRNAAGDRFVQQNGGAITDDHLAVNRAGIPCIDIIDMRPDSPNGFFDGWHTTHDTPDGLSAATLGDVGQTMLNVIYHLDQ